MQAVPSGVLSTPVVRPEPPAKTVGLCYDQNQKSDLAKKKKFAVLVSWRLWHESVVEIRVNAAPRGLRSPTTPGSHVHSRPGSSASPRSSVSTSRHLDRIVNAKCPHQPSAAIFLVLGHFSHPIAFSETEPAEVDPGAAWLRSPKSIALLAVDCTIFWTRRLACCSCAASSVLRACVGVGRWAYPF